jgi:hypothetical protein
MTESLNRDELIALLERLGSADDAEALEAARQAHTRIAASGMGWEDLLVPDEPGDEPGDEPADEPGDEPADEPGDDPADESDEANEPAPQAVEDESPAEGDEKNAESLALIGELLARSDISEELRAELEGYKSDIAEGEFLAADRKYLRAVRQRLKK